MSASSASRLSQYAEQDDLRARSLVESILAQADQEDPEDLVRSLNQLEHEQRHKLHGVCAEIKKPSELKDDERTREIQQKFEEARREVAYTDMLRSYWGEALALVLQLKQGRRATDGARVVNRRLLKLAVRRNRSGKALLREQAEDYVFTYFDTENDLQEIKEALELHRTLLSEQHSDLVDQSRRSAKRLACGTAKHTPAKQERMRALGGRERKAKQRMVVFERVLERLPDDWPTPADPEWPIQLSRKR